MPQSRFRSLMYALMTDRISGPSAGAMKAVLWGLSKIFGIIVAVRNAVFDRGWMFQGRLSVPVISVGNLAMGGSGKTPLVLWLARELRQAGRRPVVVARGYQPRGAPGLNDELRMIAAELPDVPVGFGADRYQAAELLLAQHPQADTVILDDGFQHRRLRRDLDIVVIDATNPFGNGHLLPRGILREPRSSLRRAGVVVITKSNLNPGGVPVVRDAVRRVHPGIAVVTAAHEPDGLIRLTDGAPAEVADLSGRRIGAVCSIGDPGGFVKTLEKSGLQPAVLRDFPDHHVYLQQDIESLAAQGRRDGIEVWVTTPKDAVKLKPLMPACPETSGVFFVLRLRFDILDGSDALAERIHGLSSR